jgi:hypothetical protein
MARRPGGVAPGCDLGFVWQGVSASTSGMKKAILALMAVVVLVGGVWVGWELVTWDGVNPGPLRKAYWRIRDSRNPVYEARLEMSLRQAISDEALALENQVLDSSEVLLPVVRSLGLVEAWQVEGEWAAVERLAASSDLRRSDSEFKLILSARDSNQEIAGKIIQPLGKSFFDKKQRDAATAPGGGLPPGGGR